MVRWTIRGAIVLCISLSSNLAANAVDEQQAAQQREHLIYTRIVPSIVAQTAQSAQQNCGLAALRACHSQCNGEYGMLCFYGDVCNPATHNCEHAQP